MVSGRERGQPSFEYNKRETKKRQSSSGNTRLKSYDVVVVGSGIGGLSAAALLSKYGYTVAVFESHYAPGGCAHGFMVKDSSSGGMFTFDTGPSFFSGLNPNFPAKLSNPLRTVLDAVGENVECVPYETFGLVFPEGELIHTSNFGGDGGVLQKVSRGDAGVLRQWEDLMKNMRPIADAVEAMPTAALRFDLGAVLTAVRFFPKYATIDPRAIGRLTKPFNTVLDVSGVTDLFMKNWLDLLCFCLSGLPANGTITAEMGMMMGEFYGPGASMDCPKGGAKAIVDALVRGIVKHGGSVFLNSHVDEIVIDKGQQRATGVRLRKGENAFVEAKKAVISNLSVWDLFGGGVVDTDKFPKKFIRDRLSTPPCKSFMHLHVGFRATSEDLSLLQAHYIYMGDWSRGVDAEDNAALVSIPSVHDNSLAPPGFAVLHVYTPATEDFARWEHVDRNSNQYETLKEERSAFLWTVLEKIIPDIRDRAQVVRVGTPLTHRRFLRRHRGSYGPAIRAGDASFPFPPTPVDGLLCCGDSFFPGIGVPAVAGSGVLAANSVSLDSIGPQLKLLDALTLKKN